MIEFDWEEIRRAIKDIDTLCGKVETIEDAVREDRKRMDRLEETVEKKNERDNEILEKMYQIDAKVSIHTGVAEELKKYKAVWIGFMTTVLLGMAGLGIGIVQLIAK